MDKLKIAIHENVTHGLRELSKSIKDMTPVFKDIADKEWSETKMRFKNQVDPNFKKWPMPITLRRGKGEETGSGVRSTKRGWDYVVSANFHATPPGYRFFDPTKDKILRDTGRLMKSIGRAYGSNYAIVGTDVEYAKKLQDGRFSFIGINAKTLSNVRMIVNKYMKKAGLK